MSPQEHAHDPPSNARRTALLVGEEASARPVSDAHIIVTWLNLVIPGSMLREVTRRIASAVLHAQGHKLLVPLTGAQCEVMGTQSHTRARMIQLTAIRAQVLMKSDRFDSPPHPCVSSQ